MKKCSIRDVALLAGVSTATVSRVFHGASRSSKAIKDKVEAAIVELGYHPNPAMAAIASRHFSISPNTQTTPIALLTKAGEADGRSGTSDLHGFEKFAADLGYSVFRLSIRPAMSPAEAGKILYHRGIAGILIDEGSLAGEFPAARERNSLRIRTSSALSSAEKQSSPLLFGRFPIRQFFPGRQQALPGWARAPILSCRPKS